MGPVAIDKERIGRRDFIAIMLVIMNESISVSMLFPYVGLLVVHLDSNLREADAGVMSGFVVGCFQLAQALFGPTWGKQSDRWGRKPMLALGLVGSCIFSLLFGLSGNIWMLLLFRFLYGVANGTAPLCKTMVADLTTPRTAAMGWSLMSIGWSVGSTIGPMLGGLLYDPARQLSPSLFGGTIFEERPALLPACAGTLYSLFALVIVFTMLPESNVSAEQPPWLASLMNCACCGRRAAGQEAVSTEETEQEMATVTAVNAPAPAAAVREAYGLKEMWGNLQLRQVLIMYIFCCFVNTSYTEVFPLLAILPLDEGGLGLSARPIGIIFMFIAAEAVISNMVFPALLKRTTNRSLLRLSFLIWGVSVALTPSLSYVPWVSSEPWMVATASVYFVFRTCTSAWAFCINTMAIGEIAPKKHLGAATAISHSCGNVVRALFPPFCTMLFAWSVGGGGRTVANGPQRSGVSLAPTNMTDVFATSAAHGTTATTRHMFPFDKWLTFLFLGLGIGACCFVLARMTEEDFHSRQPDDEKNTVDDAFEHPANPERVALVISSSGDSLDDMNDAHPSVVAAAPKKASEGGG